VEDMLALSCNYGQGGTAVSTVCGLPVTATTQIGTATLDSISGFPIPMLNADGSINQCRWNGVGGGNVGSAGTNAVPTADPATANNVNRIAANCQGSLFPIPVSNALTIAALDGANTVAGILQAPWTTGAVTAGNGAAVKGCLVQGSTAASCIRLTGTGFPFPSGTIAGTMQGPAQRFILSVSQAQQSGVLQACMNLAGDTNGAGTGLCNPATSSYTAYVRSSSSAGTQPIQNFLAGCTSGSQPAATVQEQNTCSNWVNAQYNVFSPKPAPCLAS
jgi:hypothetical protein